MFSLRKHKAWTPEEWPRKTVTGSGAGAALRDMVAKEVAQTHGQKGGVWASGHAAEIRGVRGIKAPTMVRRKSESAPGAAAAKQQHQSTSRASA